jgi:hypothetical protein
LNIFQEELALNAENLGMTTGGMGTFDRYLVV